MDELSAEKLLAYAEDESFYFLDFNQKCTENGVEVIYCFVENYDLCFIPHRVEDITGRTTLGIACEGKKPVIDAYRMISTKPEYAKYSLLFFVDADFDDNSHLDPHIYYTPCYSIENLFVDEKVVSKILENEYKIRTTDDKHTKALAFYRKNLTDFHQASMLFNSWYHAAKRRGLTKEMKCCLKESIPSTFIQMEIGNIRATYTKADIEKKYPLVPRLSDDEILISRLFLNYDYRRLRGKFEIQFLVSFFEYINKDAGKRAVDREYTVSNNKINLDAKRYISIFEKYVSTPCCMRYYIKTGVRAA